MRILVIRGPKSGQKLQNWLANDKKSAFSVIRPHISARPDHVEIESRIAEALDHKDLGEVLDCNPSTENLARWICERVDKCYRVDVVECSVGR